MPANYELKKWARAALKDNWQNALMVALIASLPSLVAQVMNILAGADLSLIMSDIAANTTASTVDELLAVYVQAFQMYFGAWHVRLVELIAFLITPMLTLGLLHYLQQLLRGEKDLGICMAFSRIGLFWKGIGLELMQGLRIFGWSLLGMLAMTAGFVAALLLPEELAAVGSALIIGGCVVFMVLVIRAAFSYAMIKMVMADKPASGVNECFRISRAMMDYYRARLFSLELSFILFHLGIMVLYSLLLGMVGYVVAITVQMVLSFVLNVYIQTTVSGFYLARREEMRKMTEQA